MYLSQSEMCQTGRPGCDLRYRAAVCKRWPGQGLITRVAFATWGASNVPLELLSGIGGAVSSDVPAAPGRSHIHPSRPV